MKQLELFPDPPDQDDAPIEPPPAPDGRLPDLSARFAALNARFFEGALAARCVWSERLTASAGSCAPEAGLIKISAPYHRRHPASLDATLAHEMIHLIVPGHGAAFRRMAEPIARALGIPWRELRWAQPYADASRYRWVYACDRCGREMPSRKRRVASCGACGPKAFDERHRLVLVESRKRPGPVLRGERPWRTEGRDRLAP